MIFLYYLEIPKSDFGESENLNFCNFYGIINIEDERKISFSNTFQRRLCMYTFPNQNTITIHKQKY